MNTFYTILQKHIKTQNTLLPGSSQFWLNVYHLELLNATTCPYTNVLKHNNLKFMIYYMINQMHYKLKSPYYASRYPRVKHIIMKETLDNIFLSEEQKEEIFDVFTKSQRTYRALSRFAFVLKAKMATLQITTDMGLNPINLSASNVIQIYQKNARYAFIIQDLINIIETSLSNSQHFFADPLPIKNPYNNVKFSIATLYTIYYFIKSRAYIMPILFHLYFLSNFNLSQYAINNESVIRDIFIKQYVVNTPSSFLYNKVKSMLNLNVYTNRFQIHSEFPKDWLVNIMRPYLYLNYIVEMSLNSDKRHKFSILLARVLKHFYYFNPQFGRKTFDLKLKKHVYNNVHPDFKISATDSYSCDISSAMEYTDDDWTQMTDDAPIVEDANNGHDDSSSDSHDTSSSDSSGNQDYQEFIFSEPRRLY
jgi:hypothetical protein